VLRLTADVYAQLLGHCYDTLPEEACGLLAGHPDSGKVLVCYPTANAAASARIYEVDPKEHLLADRDAEARGLAIMGVFHSHTHTPAYPSPTDVEKAPDPTWHYVVVSLASEAPILRSYRIADGAVAEEPVALETR
jgi:proteasome lid subunit RPN8/RPN11